MSKLAGDRNLAQRNEFLGVLVLRHTQKRALRLRCANLILCDKGVYTGEQLTVCQNEGQFFVQATESKQMRLLTNWFSPFARKVALALEYKGLEFEVIDGLALENHDLLWRLNPRGEVPTLIDGDLVVSNSAHILAYLDDAYTERPLLPREAKTSAQARALERLFDTRVDAILVNCSLWTWAKREDLPPPGLAEAGQRDLDQAFAQTEAALSGGGRFAFGALPGLADFALWPHLAAVAPLGFQLDAERFPKIAALFETMNATEIVRQDARRTSRFLKSMTSETHEKTKIAWRGDRIEWLLARGYHDWFTQEIRAGRVIWPLE